MSLEKLNHITSFVFDIDGVLTDGSLLVLPHGVMARRMNIKDGYALQLAIKKGYKIFIISGGNSPEVKERLQNLGITNIYMQVSDKAALLKKIMEEEQLAVANYLYMGDDIPDLQPMQLVGMPCCPADAVEEIKTIALYISAKKGGEGCVRDIIEKVMKLQENWSDDGLIQSK